MDQQQNHRRTLVLMQMFADVCFREFGNHVKFWTTINEANIFTIGGYNDVVTPPGRFSSSPGRNCSSGNSSTEPYIVGHNLLLAHASASRLYMQKYKEMQGGCVGFSIFTIGFTPSTSYKDDEIAVQRAKDFFFGWMLGPLIFGDYPDEMKRTVGSRLPVFSLEESEQVKGSSDFIGIIHYLAASVRSINFKPSLSGHPDFYSDMGASMTCWNQKLISFKSQTNTLFLNLKYLYLGNFSAFEYVVAPWAMEVVLEYLKQSYGNPPVYILENGRPLKQDCSCNRRIHRGLTIYMLTLVLCLNPLGKNGSDTRGYFVWSFMDLYELLRGYEFSFGLYTVNFSDPYRKRSPKLSAYLYTSFLKGNTTFLGSQATMQLQSNFFSSISS
ncbi:hypothetical protein HID58_056908 [Brassica napus]|uniref:Sinigrinase n=1 Tax=Brassica napus TaxID=3708 RepID=A0ABQ8APK3_BRANA|nr:hypothetical protein HID58_056908 [Brassica napus]